MPTSMRLASMLALLLPSCASAPEGPVVPMPPCVQVTHFNSTLITPEMIKFVAEVVIDNQMRGPLQIEKVDYCADLHDQPLFDETFDKLAATPSRGRTTVTLPFQVAMKDIVNQVEDVLAEESLRVTLHGQVFPVGFDAIPFEATKVVPIPRLPKIALAGANGSPLDGQFSVFLSVENTNSFPVAFGSVDTFLTLNGKRYNLLRSESFSDLPAGGTGRVALTMRQTRGNGISMLVNVVKNQSADFTVGGTLSCKTPHGVILLPVELSSTAAAPGR